MTHFLKSIFRFFTQLITLVSFISLVSPASAASNLKLNPVELAERTAKVVNHFNTVGDYAKFLEQHYSKGEIKRSLKILNTMGINESTPMIKLKVDANKVYYDKNTYMIYNADGTVTISGHIFKQQQKGPYDVILGKVNKKTMGKKSAMMGLLLPEAHAFDWGGLLNFAMVGALIGGGIFALKSIFSGGLFGGDNSDDDSGDDTYERPQPPIQ